MIKVEISAVNYELDSGLRDRVEDRIGGLDEFMSTLEQGHVTIAWEGGANEQTKVNARVWGPGVEFEGSDTDWKAVTAVDQTRHKLEAQITRKHGKDISERDRRR